MSRRVLFTLSRRVMQLRQSPVRVYPITCFHTCSPVLHIGATDLSLVIANRPTALLLLPQVTDKTTYQTSFAEKPSSERIVELLPDMIEKWGPLVDAIREATKAASAESPPSDAASCTQFQDYWRSVFLGLREKIAADETISKFVADPPATKFAVTLIDSAHVLGCPCCAPYYEPNIELNRPDGVTTLDLLDAITETMYGENFPRVYGEPDPLYNVGDGNSQGSAEQSDEIDYTADSGVVYYSSSWMSGETVADEGTHTYSSEPEIWLYCCKPERHADMMEQMKSRLEM